MRDFSDNYRGYSDLNDYLCRLIPRLVIVKHTVDAFIWVQHVNGFRHVDRDVYKRQALSYSAVDAPKLTDEKMIQLAQEYMREMKITDTQYIIVRHQDREHPHVHIVFNRIDNSGKTIFSGASMGPQA